MKRQDRRQGVKKEKGGKKKIVHRTHLLCVARLSIESSRRNNSKIFKLSNVIKTIFSTEICVTLEKYIFFAKNNSLKFLCVSRGFLYALFFWARKKIEFVHRRFGYFKNLQSVTGA